MTGLHADKNGKIRAISGWEPVDYRGNDSAEKEVEMPPEAPQEPPEAPPEPPKRKSRKRKHDEVVGSIVQ
eukprot:2700196-Prymnesium_polylepis.1